MNDHNIQTHSWDDNCGKKKKKKGSAGSFKINLPGCRQKEMGKASVKKNNKKEKSLNHLGLSGLIQRPIRENSCA